MKIPEPLFVIINPAMRLLLRSPLHFVVSSSLLLITYQGRRSGKRYTTPLRYVREGETLCCFTSRDTKWWRNLEDGAEVVLRLEGRNVRYHARTLTDDKEAAYRHIANYLAKYPQDAAYHDVRLDSDKRPLAEDLERAAQESIVVEATRVV